MVARKQFDLNAGLLIQQQQLDEWREVLKVEVFSKLKAHVELMNAQLKDTDDGYKVFRGTMIDNFIHNIMCEYANGKINR